MLHVGFHSGLFDSFNLGGVAAPGIVSVAEGCTRVCSRWVGSRAGSVPSHAPD